MEMNAHIQFEVGRAYAAHYPTANYLGVPKRWELRRFRVLEVRRLAEHPLDPLTKDLNPHLERSAVLLKVWDLDKEAERNFYDGSLVGVRELTAAELEVKPSADVLIVHGADASVPSPKAEVVKSGLSPELAIAFAEGFNEGDEVGGCCAVVVSPKVSPRASISA